MVNKQGRFRRVAAAFDEAMAARRRRQPCDSSSGSDHSPEDVADLRELVESFIDREGKPMIDDNPAEKDEDDDSSDVDDYDDVEERLRKLLGGGGGRDGCERRRITAEVEVACGIIGNKEERGPFQRRLMSYLRSKGFDAGLCKSRWEKFGKNPAGKYEYVDVKSDGITSGGGEDRNRYIVEANLAGEFEIARPTSRYLSLLAYVPRVFVGKPDELKNVVRIMCHEMRRSMKRVGIHVPPWRGNGYMQAKWFGHYKRTVNEASSASRVNAVCGCVDAGAKRRVGSEGSGRRVRIGFVESDKTAAFYGCREEYRRVPGQRLGGLSVVFSGDGIKA